MIAIAVAGFVTIGKVTNNGGMENQATKTVQTVQYDNPYREYKDVGLPVMRTKGQLLIRKDYVTSYNEETKTPFWVQWHLTRERASGTLKRPDYAFHEDNEVLGQEPTSTTTAPVVMTGATCVLQEIINTTRNLCTTLSAHERLPTGQRAKQRSME